MELALFTPTVIERCAEGYVVRPGKPVAWLTVDEFARAVGLKRKSIYIHLGGPAIPEHLFEHTGFRRYRIKAEAVEFWLSYWRQKRGLEA
jgi:hypothetical protein